MTIDRIEYQKNYNIIGMQWEKIIAGGTLEEGDDFQSCVKKLRNECDQSAQSKINSLYQEQTPIVPDINEHPAFILDHLPEPDEKITPEDTKRYIIGEIDKCKTIKELKQWDLLSRRYDDASIAYTQKEKELL